MKLFALLLAWAALGGSAPTAAIEVRVEHLRNANGVLRLCLTANRRRFPDCRKDPAARALSVPPAGAGLLRFDDVGPGHYAISIVHDENGNGRLDTFARIPREGFGFSRNPAIRLGPPRFERASFTVNGADIRQTIRMKYIL